MVLARKKKKTASTAVAKNTAGGRISKATRSVLSCWDDDDDDEDEDECDDKKESTLYGLVDAVNGSCQALVTMVHGRCVVNLPIRRKPGLTSGDVVSVTPDMRNATRCLDGIDAHSKFVVGVLHPALFWRYLGGGGR